MTCGPKTKEPLASGEATTPCRGHVKRRNVAGLLRDTVLARFQALYQDSPTWAWNLPPSIPLIGRHYVAGKSILIYASAENFSWMNGKQVPDRYSSEKALDRYRAAYDEDGRTSGSFFPNVGIQPVSDGGLLTAGLFLARKYGLAYEDDPRTFLESIAVSNWCKYTIKSEGNRDYAGKLLQLGASLRFVVCELALLQPAVVLLPNRIWRHPLLQEAMRGASPYTRYLPAPQFNATVVNCQLARLDSPAMRLQRRADSVLRLWMQNLRGVKLEHAWRYLAAIDGVILDQK